MIAEDDEVDDAEARATAAGINGALNDAERATPPERRQPGDDLQRDVDGEAGGKPIAPAVRNPGPPARPTGARTPAAKAARSPHFVQRELCRSVSRHTHSYRSRDHTVGV